jgi:hypothetical protein
MGRKGEQGEERMWLAGIREVEEEAEASMQGTETD